MSEKTFDAIIIGGGAAGFFAAVTIKEKHPGLSVVILEKGSEVLSKVRISGGGRCNLTNACPDIKAFAQHYPRGERELVSCFSRFGNKETMQWFENHGIELKTESDGRVFPQSNTSETIVQFFIQRAQKLGVSVLTQQNVSDFFKNEDEKWVVCVNEQKYYSENLIITTGSSQKIWNILEKIGHKIVLPVPSLFTFPIAEKKLHELMGISTHVLLEIDQSKIQSRGTMLLTHWGVSGPAVLKLSAWGARILADKNYHFDLTINWLPEKSIENIFEELRNVKQTLAKKNVWKNPVFGFTGRLWEYLMEKSQIPTTLNYADVSKNHLQQIAKTLNKTQFTVSGKTTFKDEFVTAGGVDLKEVHFKTMESKLYNKLYFAGEVLNIDAVTGGFNFQNAWTGAWIISDSVSF